MCRVYNVHKKENRKYIVRHCRCENCVHSSTEVRELRSTNNFRLRSDLYCVGWGVKLYSLTPRTIHMNTSAKSEPILSWLSLRVFVKLCQSPPHFVDCSAKQNERNMLREHDASMFDASCLYDWSSGSAYVEIALEEGARPENDLPLPGRFVSLYGHLSRDRLALLESGEHLYLYYLKLPSQKDANCETDYRWLLYSLNLSWDSVERFCIFFIFHFRFLYFFVSVSNEIADRVTRRNVMHTDAVRYLEFIQLVYNLTLTAISSYAEKHPLSSRAIFHESFLAISNDLSPRTQNGINFYAP